ncbi:MAG: DUF4390 domain-containing protein [Rhodocyclaceae bacterium]
MASTMRCCAKLLRSLFFSAMLLGALGALAGEIEIRSARLIADEDSYALAADFNIDFNARLEEAVAKGVVLYFVTEFELTRPRWYWLDEKVASRTQTFRLSYHALTRQYRLSTGALHQSFETLDETLRMLARLRNWSVLEKSAVKADETYLAGLRLRLDLTQMPKTFQVTAIANRDWNLASDWVRWTFIAGDTKGGGSETK